jgi:hypothetical protein
MADYECSLARDTVIRFPQKPSEEIRSLLKCAGFRWSPTAACWWRRGVQGAADFLAQLDKRLHPGHPDGACWRCKSPQGFFRNQGAAAPVYCNRCWAEVQEMLAKDGYIDRFDLDYEDRCKEACGL